MPRHMYIQMFIIKCNVLKELILLYTTTFVIIISSFTFGNQMSSFVIVLDSAA